MKRILTVILLMLVLLSFNSCVFATESDVNVYQEYVFEFEKDNLSINDITELKLNANFKIKDDDIKWTVSDNEIVKLADGKIYPLNNGTIIITAEYLPLNLKTSCTAEVKFSVGTPTLVVTTNTYNSLKITYSKDKNATHYEVQRATKKNGKYKTVATTTGTSYTDKNLKCGTSYYYKVRAINKNNGIKGKYSSIKSKKVIPAKVTIASKKVKTYNSNYIKWNKVGGASGYRVYRATSKNGKYERILTTTNTSYTDKYLKTGKTYYYKVRAYKLVNGAKVFGAYSEVFSLKPQLSKPSIEAYQSGTGVKVKLSKVKDAVRYRVYKATSKNGKYTRISDTTSLTTTDKEIKYTSGYYYKARAYRYVDGKKVYSSYTTPVYIKTYVPKPTITVSRYDTTKLKVSWSKLNGVSGYELYISEDGKEYKTLKNITSYKTESYTKSGLKINKKYYIKARSYKTINGKKVYSGYSSVKTYTLTQFMQALKVKNDCNIRSVASSNYKTVGTVKEDQIVLSYGKEGNYYRVKINNKFGYIHKNSVTKYNDAKVLVASNINQFSNQGGPMLPMGCEVTSLAVVLKYLGFSSVTKNLLADKYQPMGKVGKTDPNVAFVGTPYSSKPYGCYAPVIVKTAENYFNAIGNNKYQVNNLTGMAIEDLYKEIDKGNPLIMWMTCGKPHYQESWTLNYGTKTTKPGEGKYKFTWYGLQHCVALVGYNKSKKTLIFADVGKSGELTEYSISYLKSGYNKLGKQVVSITEKQTESVVLK